MAAPQGAVFKKRDAELIQKQLERIRNRATYDAGAQTNRPVRQRREVVFKNIGTSVVPAFGCGSVRMFESALHSDNGSEFVLGFKAMTSIDSAEHVHFALNGPEPVERNGYGKLQTTPVMLAMLETGTVNPFDYVGPSPDTEYILNNDGPHSGMFVNLGRVDIRKKLYIVQACRYPAIFIKAPEGGIPGKTGPLHIGVATCQVWEMNEANELVHDLNPLREFADRPIYNISNDAMLVDGDRFGEAVFHNLHWWLRTPDCDVSGFTIGFSEGFW